MMFLSAFEGRLSVLPAQKMVYSHVQRLSLDLVTLGGENSISSLVNGSVLSYERLVSTLLACYANDVCVSVLKGAIWKEQRFSG